MNDSRSSSEKEIEVPQSISNKSDESPKGSQREEEEERTASSHESNKIFIGGLGPETSEGKFNQRDSSLDDLKAYFSKYGEVEEAIIKYDSDTKRSRGFGFVTFKQNSRLTEVLDEENHEIMGHRIDCKMAMTKEEAFQKQKIQISQNRKLFVNNLPKGTKKRDLRALFGQFGRIVEVNVIFKKKATGFGFVVFEDSSQAKAAIEAGELSIADNKISVKLAIPKNELQKNATEEKPKIKIKSAPMMMDDEESRMIEANIMAQQRRRAYRAQRSMDSQAYSSSRYLEEEYPPESPYLPPDDMYDYRRVPAPQSVYRAAPPPPPMPRIEGYLECPTCSTHVPVPRSRFIRAPSYYDDPRMPMREPHHDPRYAYEDLGYVPRSPYFHPTPPQSPYLNHPYDRPHQPPMYEDDYRSYAGEMSMADMKSPGYSLRENRKKRNKKKKNPKTKYLKNTKTVDDIDASFAKKINSKKKDSISTVKKS